MTGYDFKLISWLVSDELDERKPAINCTSKNKTFQFMEIFFKEVKDN